jgi:hypothetical protein
MDEAVQPAANAIRLPETHKSGKFHPLKTTTKKTPSSHLRRMAKAPVTIRRGNVIPALSNDAMATLLEGSDESLP